MTSCIGIKRLFFLMKQTGQAVSCRSSLQVTSQAIKKCCTLFTRCDLLWALGSLWNLTRVINDIKMFNVRMTTTPALKASFWVTEPCMGNRNVIDWNKSRPWEHDSDKFPRVYSCTTSLSMSGSMPCWSLNSMWWSPCCCHF